MAAQLPSAAKPTIGATAHDLTTFNVEALVSRMAELNATAKRDRESAARAMLEMGNALCVIKEALPHGIFEQAVQKMGIERSVARRSMRTALRIAKHVPAAAMEKFLSTGKTGLMELASLEEEGWDQLAQTGEYCGLRLAELPGMTVMEIRQAVKSINEDDGQVHALCADKLAAIDAILGHGLQVGDVVESRYSKRPGRAVKIYPDGSACVCWDDGEPQPEGMGHERMPRELLRLVERAAPAAPAPEPEADPARVKAHMEISAILKAIAAKVPTAPASAPAQSPLPADPAARPENVICMQEARLRSSAMTAAELSARDPARLKAYCADLLPLLIENAGAAEMETLAMVLEEMIADQVRERPLPDVVAARYAIYCRRWLEGQRGVSTLENTVRDSAAPELYDAAKKAEAMLTRQKWRADPYSPEGALLIELRAALAKAEGGAK